jgi:uncharacterized protein (DUF433 family)
MSAKIINLSEHRRSNGEAPGFYLRREAARLALLAPSTVDYWNHEGIIVPTLAWTDEDGKTREGYSFQDVLYMRLVAILRPKHPMRDVVYALKHITDRVGPPGPRWANVVIVPDAEVWVKVPDDKWGRTSAMRGGQRGWEEFFGEAFQQLQQRSDALLVPQGFAKHVEVDPATRNGAPIIRSTTITTKVVHTLRKQGMSIDDILEYYPVLKRVQATKAGRYENFLDYRGLAA